MINKNRNLAQKWRAKTFTQIVGQPLCVRMLQNSLYANRIFPVYLFSGQRGCGKTSTARIFAAALNCAALEQFRIDPKAHPIPCLHCDSCRAMSNQEHPDFIEMDAASHTGVDNIRDIIDAASLVPVLGRMRIYLLDEAHMLSKAAFNAFLKILEEPPMSVVFILATTDLQKIIDTVRSRCFNVFFNPVNHQELVDHLQRVCAQEAIEADEAGLARIAYHCQGCVRDALTLVEQVFYAHRTITTTTVGQTLGTVHELLILELVQALLQADMSAVCTAIANLGAHYDPVSLADAIVLVLRLGIWYQLQIPAEHMLYQHEQFIACMQRSSPVRMLELLQQWADRELAFTKAINKRLFLETFLMRAGMSSVGALPANNSLPSVHTEAVPQAVIPQASIPVKAAPTEVPSRLPHEQRWHDFISLIESKGDNLLYSMFKQGRCLATDLEAGIIDMVLPDSLLLFKDMIDKHKPLWSACLAEIYGKEITLTVIFDAHTPLSPVEPKGQEIKKSSMSAPASTVPVKKNNFASVRQKQVPIDVSDTQKWQKTSLVLEFFPGTVTKVGESS